MRRACSFGFLIAMLGLGPLGCTSVTTDLGAAQTLYEDARYEQALLWLVELEAQRAAMESRDLLRFYYLRGMTAFRLGQREDALHYLVLADALRAEDARLLPAHWHPVMQRTLSDITPIGASPHARNPLRPDTI